MSTRSRTTSRGSPSPSVWWGLLAVTCSVAMPAKASAQSLDTFLSAVSTHSPEQREAEAVAQQRREESSQALSALLPSVSVSGGYTRNQQAVELTLPDGGNGTATRTVTITPIDQLEANVRLEIPLLNLSAIQRNSAARALEEAARERSHSTLQDLRRSVARTWFQWTGASALVRSTEQSLQVSTRTLARAQARVQAGVGSMLDVRRAEAEVARNRQTFAEARASATIAAHSLEASTGIPASQPLYLDDDLREEAPLEEWLGPSQAQPAVRAARAELQAAQAQARAGWSALAPTLSGTLQERLTNAAGFGFPAFFSAGLTLSWRLDGTTLFAARANDAVRNAAETRVERAERAARDAVFNDYTNLQANLERARAARAQLTSAEAAVEEAQSRLNRGTATEYDVLVAEREAFSARVARIQSDVDLQYARVLLRLDAGRPLTPNGATPWR